MQASIDNLWLVVATFLVLLMQCGFLLLEGGRVRSKNSINVAQKNISDVVVVWAGYFTIGFYLMFGVSVFELIEGNIWGASPLHFIYQFAFACTTATIISGAIVERVSFRAYLVLVAVMTTLFYPIVGKFIWGSTYRSDTASPLADIGFIDFAGSTVVHGTGAWFGLVALLMLGPRLGRFDQDGRVQTIAAHNSVIALCGVLLLKLGWLGFNGGSLSPTGPLLHSVLFNTIGSGAFGAVAGMIVGVILDKGVFNPSRVVTGLLGGLVACTAGVHFMGAYDAVIVGVIGGALATYAADVLLHRFKLDDPLDVVATHGIAGVFGTLSVAWLAPVGALASGSRIWQLVVQSIGVGAVFLASCISCWLTVTLIKRFMPFRVSEKAELIGLNYTEHGENVGVGRLQQALENHDIDGENASNLAMVDADDEHSELAASLNKVISRYEKANHAVMAANVRFQQFAETATDWLWESDEHLSITFVHANSQHADSDNAMYKSLLGRNLFDLFEMEDTVKKQLSHNVHQHKSTDVFEATLHPFRDNRTTYAVEVRGVPFNDSQGKHLGYRGTITDISVRKAAESRAVFLSLHDDLTGLSNRRALASHFSAYMAEAQKNDRALVVTGVDLDGFKAVNDAYGHLVGDALLKQVAERLERFLRPTDKAYRTGGDEFVIVLTDLDPGQAERLSKAIIHRLLEDISQLYYVQTLDINIGASAGIAIFPEHEENYDGLLRKADLAMYEAKGRGKGQVVVYENTMDVDAKLQKKVESDLHKAVANKEFYLKYQPQVDTRNGQLLGFEALIRWSHPDRGEIPPGDFIAMAEKLNLMDKIGEFVLNSACEFAAQWPVPKHGKPIKIGVNVSPQQFRSGQFYSTVKEALQKHQLAAERLEIEITEDLLVHDFHEVSQVLQAIRHLGVSVAIDDFGSGQTSLRYLSQFPLSTIKIDRSFIREVASDEKAAEITQTIVELGHRLGVTVLAEGVEENNQLALLKEWRCDQIQGFLFAKPMSVSEVVNSLECEANGEQWSDAA